MVDWDYVNGPPSDDGDADHEVAGAASQQVGVPDDPQPFKKNWKELEYWREQFRKTGSEHSAKMCEKLIE
jgi:hypothetical protein